MDITEARSIIERNISFNIKRGDAAEIGKTEKFCNQMMNEVDHKDIWAKGISASEDEHEAIEHVYRPYTKFAINPLIQLFKKRYRADNIRKDFKHPDENKDKLIQDAVSNFKRGERPEQYVARNFDQWNFETPNSWLMVEKISKDGENGDIELVQSYPHFIRANHVVNFEEDKQGEVLWALFEFKRREYVYIEANGNTPPRVKEGKIVSDYYFYTAGLTVTYSESVDAEPEAKGGIDLGSVTIPIVDERPRTFFVESFNTGSKEFPGIRVGAYEKDGYRIPPYWPAENVLKDIVVHKAQKDIIENKHIFMKLIVYVDECQHCAGTGVNYDGGGKCTKCEDGYTQGFHKNSQSVLKIVYPRDAEDASKVPSLDKRYHFVETETEKVKYYGEQLDGAISQVPIAMFGVITQERVNPRFGNVDTKTATEIEAENQTVNNGVLHLARHEEKVILKIYRVTAQFVGADSGYEPVFSFSPDLKLETLENLLMQYEKAKGMNHEIRWNIECDIMQKQNTDTPERIAMAKAMNAHIPFVSLSDEMAFQEIMRREADDPDAVIWLNRDRIFREVYERFPDFPKMAYSRQKEIVAEIAGEMTPRYVQAQPLPLGIDEI